MKVRKKLPRKYLFTPLSIPNNSYQYSIFSYTKLIEVIHTFTHISQRVHFFQPMSLSVINNSHVWWDNSAVQFNWNASIYWKWNKGGGFKSHISSHIENCGVLRVKPYLLHILCLLNLCKNITNGILEWEILRILKKYEKQLKKVNGSMNVALDHNKIYTIWWSQFWFKFNASHLFVKIKQESMQVTKCLFLTWQNIQHAALCSLWL